MDDPISRSISFIVIGICILLHFFFSSSETALSCCNRFKMQLEADEGSFTAKLVLKVCDKFDRALTTVLIGSNIAAILSSLLMTNLFLYYFESSMGESLAGLIASISLSLAIYIIGDALPKTIAKAIPDTLSKMNIIPVYLICWVLTYVLPITLLFELFVKFTEKVFKVKNESEFTEEDFEDVVDKVAEEGVIEEDQAEIIQSALEFVDTNVKEVLTPKEKIFALNIKEIDHDDIKGILMSTRYSRIPVYDTSFDNVIGVLNVKTYFKEVYKNPRVSIRKILTKPYFVNNSIMIDDLFNGFKKNHTHIALVRDNKRQIVGMVTMEDVLEELVDGISEPLTQKVRGR